MSGAPSRPARARAPALPAAPSAGDEIRIGVSSCLLGEEVRFDGGHKRDPFITGTLAAFVTFVPVCPEVEIGLGTPRESIRLVRTAGGVRLVAPKSGADHTARMTRYARRRAQELAALDLSGYLFKKDSPSCVVFRVRVHQPGGMPARDGRGLFAAAMVASQPLLPVEEEGRLHDPHLRDNFWERVFGFRRLARLFAGRWRTGGLVRFHTAGKLLLMAHHIESYRALGRLVAGAARRSGRGDRR